MSKLAIIQNADEPQIISTAVMLRAVGYDEVKICGPALRNELMKAGCDTVLSVQQMYALGYDRLDPSIGEATPDDIKRCDLFCEIKVRNVSKITESWRHLKGRVLYWRVNGAQPEICPRGGDEVNLPCPIATACLWYGLDRYKHGRGDQASAVHEYGANRPVSEAEQREWASQVKLHDPDSNAYVFWPPYPRSKDYDAVDREAECGKRGHWDPAYCMAHSARAWGYGPVVDDCVRLGVRVFGNNAPAGQVPHSSVPGIAAASLALVHLKSVDCPGWALYEALLAGCPVITGRLLNSRMLAYGLLEDNVTCLEFGVPAALEYGRGDMDYPKCTYDIDAALNQLRDPAENLRIGRAGRQRLNEIMWSKDKSEDVASFAAFMRRHFG